MTDQGFDVQITGSPSTKCPKCQAEGPKTLSPLDFPQAARQEVQEAYEQTARQGNFLTLHECQSCLARYAVVHEQPKPKAQSQQQKPQGPNRHARRLQEAKGRERLKHLVRQAKRAEQKRKAH